MRPDPQGLAPMAWHPWVTSAEVGVIIKAAIPVEVSVSSMAQDHKSIGVDHQILYGYASIPSSCVFQCVLYLYVRKLLIYFWQNSCQLTDLADLFPTHSDLLREFCHGS